MKWVKFDEEEGSLAIQASSSVWRMYVVNGGDGDWDQLSLVTFANFPFHLPLKSGLDFCCLGA